jgi:hypothetical protein
MIVVRSLRSSRSKGEPDSSRECYVRQYIQSVGHELATMPLERLIGMLLKKRPMVLMGFRSQHRRSRTGNIIAKPKPAGHSHTSGPGSNNPRSPR